MTFWKACAEYEQTSDVNKRRELALKIFDAHLVEKAPEAVNVDAHARPLAADMERAPLQLFLSAQKQVFNLMKMDSYPRFLKSSLYQEVSNLCF